MIRRLRERVADAIAPGDDDVPTPGIEATSLELMQTTRLQDVPRRLVPHRVDQLLQESTGPMRIVVTPAAGDRATIEFALVEDGGERGGWIVVTGDGEVADA